MVDSSLVQWEVKQYVNQLEQEVEVVADLKRIEKDIEKALKLYYTKSTR